MRYHTIVYNIINDDYQDGAQRFPGVVFLLDPTCRRTSHLPAAFFNLESDSSQGIQASSMAPPVKGKPLTFTGLFIPSAAGANQMCPLPNKG